MLFGEVTHTSLLLEPEDVGQGFTGLGCPGLAGHVQSRQLYPGITKFKVGQEIKCLAWH